MRKKIKKKTKFIFFNLDSLKTGGGEYDCSSRVTESWRLITGS